MHRNGESRQWPRRFLFTAGALCLLLGGGCAGIGTIRSQVVDAQTGQPVQGAVVLGVWTKGAGLPGLSHTELVGVREAETDADGRFELEQVRRWLLDEKSITVYKFGYVAWSNQFIFPSFQRREDTRVPDTIRLDPFPFGGNHQDHMSFVRMATSSSLSAGDPAYVKWRNALERENRMR
jgi:hypothetical protein